MKIFEHNDFTLELKTSEIETNFSGKDLVLNESIVTAKASDFVLNKISYVYKDSMKKFVVEVNYRTLNKNKEPITKTATFDTELRDFQFKNENNTHWLTMPLGTVKKGEHKGEQFIVRYVLINNQKIVVFHPEDMLKAVEANKESEQQAMSLIFAIRGAIYSIYEEDLDVYGLDIK